MTANAGEVFPLICRVGQKSAVFLRAGDRWRDELIDVAAARTEAPGLDLLYPEKPMAGLIELARQGRFGTGKTVPWIHAVGGISGLFAYPEKTARLSTLGG